MWLGPACSLVSQSWKAAVSVLREGVEGEHAGLPSRAASAGGEMGGGHAPPSLACLDPGFTLQIFALPQWAAVIGFHWILVLDKASHHMKGWSGWEMEEMPLSPSSSPGSGTCSIIAGTGAAARDCY